MSKFLPSTTRLLATLAVACLLCAGLTLPRAPRAEACSADFSFNFEYFLEAETLDDLHDPEGPYAQAWAKYFGDGDAALELERITGVSLTHIVAEVQAEVIETPHRLFGGVATLQHRWGQTNDTENPRTINLRPNASSCAHLNVLPDLGEDTWSLNGRHESNSRRSFNDVPTPDLVAALTRLFGEPISPQRNIDREGEIIVELTRQLNTRDENLVVLPADPATWLNPATGLVQAWDGFPATQTPPIPAFTG